MKLDTSYDWVDDMYRRKDKNIRRLRADIEFREREIRRWEQYPTQENIDEIHSLQESYMRYVMNPREYKEYMLEKYYVNRDQ